MSACAELVRRPGRPRGSRDYTREQLLAELARVERELARRTQGRPTEVERADAIGISPTTLRRYRREYVVPARAD